MLSVTAFMMVGVVAGAGTGAWVSAATGNLGAIVKVTAAGTVIAGARAGTGARAGAGAGAGTGATIGSGTKPRALAAAVARIQRSSSWSTSSWRRRTRRWSSASSLRFLCQM